MRTILLLTIATCAGQANADGVYLSDYLGQPSGSAAIAPNPPYTTISTAALPYGFGVDCPGTFASSKITFQDAGQFNKGIGQHPFESGEKRINFSLAAIRVHTTRDVAVFSARVGVDLTTSIANNGGVFRVLVDGVEKVSQSIGGRNSPSIPIAVSVVGASTLSLITTRTGAFNSNHLCWADASVTLLGGACPSDINGDRLVDDSDFSAFALAYNILDCADPAMAAECPADFTGDDVVDDADFSVFVVAYNELICP